MRNFFNKILFSALVTVFAVALTGCNPEEDTSVYAKIHEVGPEYVDVYVNGATPLQVAYVVKEKEEPESASMIFMTGTNLTVKPQSVFRISGKLRQNTQYYLYLAARVDAMTYYEVCLPFKTAVYQDTGELLTVVSKDYNSYMMRITVPASAKNAGNAIRFNQCDIMMYNYMRPERNDYSSLLYNAGNFALRDTTVTYSEEENWYETGTDSDGDGKIDLDTYYNPISPGEPIVYVAGEFAYMSEPEEYKTGGSMEKYTYSVKGFPFPGGWVDGYYVPCVDSVSYWLLADPESMKDTPAKPSVAAKSSGFITDVDMTSEYDKCWTGAHKRVLFQLQEPEKLDAKVNVELVDVSPIDATLYLVPEDGVEMYAFGIFDEGTYKKILELCEGRKEWLQWAMTSYFSAYTFGTRVAYEAVAAKITTFYYQTAVTENTKYYLLITAMGNSEGSSQSFTTYEFETTSKEKDAPEVKVTPIETGHPHVASFNIKCTSYADNPLILGYYAADYVCNWQLDINSGKTYFSLTDGNNAFTEDELEKINSAAGYDIHIPTVDGQTVRCVVVGYNDEYSPNDLNYKDITKCPGVADYEAPYEEEATWVDPVHYIDLSGDWTATANLWSAKDSKEFEHTSKFSLIDDLVNYDYDDVLPQSIYDLYMAPKKNGKPGLTRDEVDALWTEFKQMAVEFTTHRLTGSDDAVGKNRLLGLGWMNKDSWDRLDARTPYDLFVATDYSSVDVNSLYFDFGPKWFLETRMVDGKPEYSIPMDSRLLPPAANFKGYFNLYMMERGEWNAVDYSEGETALRFPVTVSEDRNTITIHPIMYPLDITKPDELTPFYPQMIGVDYSTMQTICENPVVSDIVLTRGWKEPENSQQSSPAVRSFSQSESVPVEVDPLFKGTFKSMTGFPEPIELKEMELKPSTLDEFEKRADELVEKYLNRTK